MTDPLSDPISALVPSFQRSLRARRRSPKTIRSYTEAVRFFVAYQTAAGRPLEPSAVTRAHVEDFIIDQLERWAPTTAANRYRSLQQFWRWCVDEAEITMSPMVAMSPPQVPEKVVPVIDDVDLKALLQVCEGTGFVNRRDAALMRLFFASGARLAEVAGLLRTDLDLDAGAVVVTGKGDRSRTVAFGPKTALALDRYERERRKHRLAERPELWLGVKGPLTPAGVSQMMTRRAIAAGVDGMHVHRFRHTFAHRWLDAGGAEGDLQVLAGWRSPQMLARYGASARSARARRAYRRMDIEGDL